MKGRITLFTVSGCPSCHRVIGFLKERQLEYTSVDLDRNPAVRDHVLQLCSNDMTVPKLFFNNRCVGGWDELNNMPRQEFDQLVRFVEDTEPSDEALKMLQLVDESTEACEDMDDYAQLIRKMKDTDLIGSHIRGETTYEKSFVGKEAIDWLVKEKSISREEAVGMFREILSDTYTTGGDGEVFEDNDGLYTLLEDRAVLTAPANHAPETVSTLSATTAAKEIRMLMLSLYGSHLSEDGRKVDYKKIGEDPEFEVFKQKTEQLRDVSLKDVSREEKIAFFINLYNALVVHKFVELGPPGNMWHRYKFFNTASYIIDGQRYSLQDMENGVLRANRKGIGAFQKPFSSGDPRLAVALEECEPRVHFALVCGAKSCPPIGTYQAEKIDQQLDIATRSFIGGSDVVVDLAKREVQISQIFKWYSIDFGKSKREVVQWIHDHMTAGEKKSQLNKLMEGKFKLSHLTYNWGLNKK